MQVKVTYPSDTQATITIVADETALKSLKEHVLTHFATDAKLPGFRQGKVPLSLVEKNVDQAALQTRFLEEAVEQLYVQAIKSEKVRVVANPQISLKKFVPYTALEFDAEVAVIKSITLPDYTKNKLAKPTVTITGDDVTEVLGRLKAQGAERQPVERPAKNGDEVVIDFKGVDAKTEAPISGADSKDYPLLLGSNTFIPGFEPNLIGMTTGEEKTFVLTFPKDYGVATLANRKVSFTVKVTSVSEVAEPVLDDAFAAKVGPFTSLKELKADIKKQLTVERQREADRDYEAQLVKQIVDKSTVSVPDVLIDEQVERIEQEERQNLAYRGQTWQEHLAEEGVTEEEHHKQKRPVAEERIKTGLVLAEIAEKEKLTVTAEELEIRIQLLKGQYQDKTMQSELDKPENRRDIEARLLTEKTLDRLVKSAEKQ